MKLLTFDIETLKAIFLLCVYDVQTGEEYSFEISRRKNQIDLLIKFLEEHEDYWWIGFNNLRFDSQVVEWMYRNYHKWWDIPSIEIAKMAYQKAQDVIDDANYEVFPEYKESQLSFKQIDLFTIWHFNNENRRTSLKAVEFAIDFENIEELPVDVHKEDMTDEEMDDVISYCFNDVRATYQFYLITIGDTSLALYKGENKIEDRLIMEREFGLPCLNWDDVKIGSEWNKLDYVKMTGRAEKDLKPLVVEQFYGKRFKKFFPKTVKFQTKSLKEFVTNLGNTFVLNKKQEFKYTFSNGLMITLAKGGAHSNEVGRFLKPKEDEIYLSCDISSQYPNAIRKYKVEPSHLPGWNKLITAKIDRRLAYKKLAKETKDPRYNSMQKMGKLSMNGGAFGRLNTKGDWQEYPMGMLQVTIGCQLEILMIIEDLILRGFNVVTCNTDGFDVILSKSREYEFKEIIASWEKVIGNDVLGNFEYTEFKWIAQTSVNDYLALKSDGELKTKGDFEIDKEINKNKSARIVPIALKEYFVNGVPVEETIRNHTNIYNFCIRQKSSRDFHYEGIIKSTGEKTIYNKLIRYYVSLEGEKVYKIKNPSCQTNAAERIQVEAGEWLCFVCNKLSPSHPTTNVNFEYYIERTNRIIAKVEGKKATIKKDINQLTLF